MTSTAPARSVVVQVPGLGARALLGPPAELVALITAASLSARTVALLRAIALEEHRLALIDTGSLTADLAPGQLRLHLHQSRPRLDVGKP